VAVRPHEARSNTGFLRAVRRSGKSSPGQKEVHIAPIEVLIPRASEGGDPVAREELARRLMPFARSLALRYRHGNEPIEDLFQVACLGLVKAINRFDPERGTSFQSFAAPTILGELKRHFRDRVMPIHLSRGLKEDVLDVNEAADELTGELDREPSLPELADRAEMSEQQVAEAVQASSAVRTVSLDAPWGEASDRSQTVVETVGGMDHQLELAEARTALGRAFRVLDRREREVVHLRFASDLTQQRIAERVGVSQVHVSRILHGALIKLRAAVGEGNHFEEAA
jgi:RNA polymerase sigma-B factor